MEKKQSTQTPSASSTTGSRSRARNEILRERRRTGIGGTDVAAILGYHPYKTVHDVWLEKLGYVEHQEESEAAKWGRLVEPVLLRDYADERGVDLDIPDEGFVLRADRCAYLIGHPDALVRGERGGVDAKMAGLRQMPRWGETGTDEVPEEYLIQMQHYLALTGYEWWDIVALLGQERRIYRILPDADLQGIMAEACHKFWQDHVLTKIPPAPDASEAARKVVLARFPQNKEPLRQATEDEIKRALKLHVAKVDLEEATARYEALQTILSDSIGLADGIEGRFARTNSATDEPYQVAFTITFKRNKDGEKTDWKKAFADLKYEWLAAAGDRPEIHEALEVIRKRHTAVVPGVRVFRPKFKEEE
jgi:putative phage-type endonuclease